jgi:hypothetical protein
VGKPGRPWSRTPTLRPSVWNENLWRDMSLPFVGTLPLDRTAQLANCMDVSQNYGQFRYTSNPAQCAKISRDMIQEMLKDADNFFADYTPVWPPYDFMCLPPKSSILMGPNSVTISTPFCEISFLIDPKWIMAYYLKPGTNGGETPLLGGRSSKIYYKNGPCTCNNQIRMDTSTASRDAQISDLGKRHCGRFVQVVRHGYIRKLARRRLQLDVCAGI